MTNAARRILVCAAQMATLHELRRLLVATGLDVDGHLLGTPDPDTPGTYELILVEGIPGSPDGLDLARRLRSRLDEKFVPVIYVTDDPGPTARLAAFEAGCDAYLLRPFAPGELLAQVTAFRRIKELHDRLAEKTAEIHRINKRLQQAYQQIDQELELAQRLQTSFLPQSLPEVPATRFAVQYLLCGRVGGDFYDAFRLDEQHVGFYVADAMGHGVPASLLTIFVKKGVRPKEVMGSQYRLVPPAEVLARLNRDLIEQKLSEHPFITLAYGLLNHQEGTLRLARAGHPYPLYIPREGPPVFWRQEGLLLGVVEATFREATYQLQPGDKVLLYSDGIDNASFEGHDSGADSLLACAECHRELPARQFVERLARDLFGVRELPDDLTLFALERLPIV
jgi:sigma-B regulation protein RsbU (phosphoserine phosphatase)